MAYELDDWPGVGRFLLLFQLMFLFTVVPLVELFLLIRIGQVIGPWNAFAIVVITGIVGAWFARSQGRQVLNSIQRQAAQGQVPADSLVHGLMILIGGILLVTPGVMTDIVGLSLVFPWTRHLFVQKFKAFLEKRIQAGQVQVFHSFGGGPQGGGFYSAQQEWQRQSSRSPRDVVDITPEKPDESGDDPKRIKD